MAMVRFGDVAERVNTKEDRLNTDLVYYVGGDHIESNALTVSGRGKIKEADLGPMFYFGFKPGDILFVTRNPHLRKCALVNFSGICSEKTLVIGTKDENVLYQKYLAAVMQSDDFWEFMEENKSGSVNYFVNWTTLADYEFNLPSLARQHELADLIWAANDLKESYKKAITATDEMLKAKFREMFGNPVQESTHTLDEMTYDLRYGISQPPQFDEHGTYKFIRATNIDKGKIVEKDMLKIADSELERVAKCRLKGREVIIVRSGANAGDSSYIPESYAGSFAGYDIIVCIDENKADPQYIAFVLAMPEYFRSKIKPMTARTAQPHINAEQVRSLPMPLPPLSLQREFVAIADKAESAKANLKKSIAAIDQVMKGLING